MANEKQKPKGGKYSAKGPQKKGGSFFKNAKGGPSTITIVAICLATVAIVAGLIAGCFYVINQSQASDTILENVSVAGVDLGGMTKQVARHAILSATDKTYSENTMIVNIDGEQVEILPSQSRIKLDVDAAVDAAYKYGHTGSAAQRRQDKETALRDGYCVPAEIFLSWNQDGIDKALSPLKGKFSSTLKQTSYTIAGDVPSLEESAEDVPGQVLLITVGTPEYALDMNVLSKTIFEAYGRNEFLVETTCTSKTPDALNLQEIYDTHCIAPKDAVLNPETFEVEPGSYGYGFDIAAAQEALNNAKYGDVIEIPLARIAPEVLSTTLSTLLYRDVLATYTADSTSDANRNTNLALACKAINGTILEPNEVFYYNKVLGERTAEKGYKPGSSYSGNETVLTIGGGICQVSSSLYYCALVADLEIVEREAHAFKPSYMPLGIDATVNWGTLDFAFRNTTEYPIRIEATADGGKVTVNLVGTDVRDYYVEIESEELKTYDYETTYEEMSSNNEKGYKDGDFIVTPYKGYDVQTYRCKYNKETKELISREPEATSNYRKRDAVICKIKSSSAPVITLPLPDLSGGISDSGGALPPE